LNLILNKPHHDESKLSINRIYFDIHLHDDAAMSIDQGRDSAAHAADTVHQNTSRH
jgi:hypothetical protein